MATMSPTVLWLPGLATRPLFPQARVPLPLVPLGDHRPCFVCTLGAQGARAPLLPFHPVVWLKMWLKKKKVQLELACDTAVTLSLATLVSHTGVPGSRPGRSLVKELPGGSRRWLRFWGPCRPWGSPGCSGLLALAVGGVWGVSQYMGGLWSVPLQEKPKGKFKINTRNSPPRPCSSV